MSETNNESQKETVIQIGGSIEKAERGEYHLDIKAILNEAWQETLKSRLAINMGFLFVICLAMSLTFLIGDHLMGGLEEVMEDQQGSLLLNIIVTLAIAPFLAGVEMMGVYHSVKLKTHGRLVFAFMQRGSLVALCALISSALTSLGLMLFIPGIYLMVALSLTMPLILEKKLSPLQAIIVSLKATRFQWLKMFALYSIIALALIAIMIPVIQIASGSFGFLGAALAVFVFSYLVPLFYNVKGIIYREIFGLTLHAINGENVKGDITFSA